MILRRHAVSIGYDANYSILDSEDAREMLNVCVDEAAIDTTKKRFPKAEIVQSIISYANNTDCPDRGCDRQQISLFRDAHRADQTRRCDLPDRANKSEM